MVFSKAVFLALALPGDVDASSCKCLYAGQNISKDIYEKYPNKDPADCDTSVADVAGAKKGTCKKYPGMYKAEKAIAYYGSSCAPWDQMPGTPWHSYCPEGSTWSHPDYNWCQQPWCYVDSACSSGVASSVYTGSTIAKYSYAACGAPDCYTNIAWNANYTWPTNCPYDPSGGQTYKIHKTGNCACKFQGKHLDKTNIIDKFPEKDPKDCVVDDKDDKKKCKKYPGMYKDLPAILLYGTTCASWDQMPGTPWFSYCPAKQKDDSATDWCHYDYNWCQQAWCYVDDGCTTGVASSVFKGSTVAKYSYNTCLDSPDCYTDIAWKGADAKKVAACPFDSADNGWYTSKQCPNGWSNGTAKSGDGSKTTTAAAGSSALVAGARENSMFAGITAMTAFFSILA